ncbi:alpha/beta fold hydrolase [Dyella subtropica]|uniref:alpha/beta fold hydrolase n=1 Tax=Dyella subtropica TaxID=2992127 RepID=UPI00225A49A8|nr:alpha/beta hydrolase [Dyella subtropica]
MPFFQATDGTRLFYEDWGQGDPMVFVSSWALDSRMWAPHMLHFSAAGRRCIALDRRGHGRSDRPGGGYDYDRLADDLAELIAHLDLDRITLVAHSMGTGESIRYLARHGTRRIARAIYLGAISPCYLRNASHPDGIGPEVIEQVIAEIAGDLPAWLAEGADGFFLPRSTGTSAETIRHTIDIILDASLKALVECIRTKLNADLRDELQQLDLPLLLIHGDRDVSESLANSQAIQALVEGSHMISYEGAPHGLFHTHRSRLIADIERFMLETHQGHTRAAPASSLA